MNWSTLQGKWNDAKGQIKSNWGRLTDDDLMQAQGQKDRLIGVIQHRYGISRENAEQQLEEFLSGDESWLEKAKEGVADAVETGKEYVHRGREYVRETSYSDMAKDFRDLIVRHPVQSAVIGIGLGFLVGRLVMSATRSST